MASTEEHQDNTGEELSESEVLDGIRKIRDDPVLFSKALLDITPFPYQVGFLRDKNRRIVVCAGRQIGKSLVTAIRALWFAITNPCTSTLIVSATMRQSMMTFQKISRLLESTSLLRGSLEYNSKTKIRFSNGSEIVALPCGRLGYGLRGHTAHQLIMDEAAFMPDRVIAEVLLPTLATTQGTAVMISTPFDKNHIFFKAFSSPGWSKYQFPSSVNPLISSEYLREQRELIGEKRFAQEFLAEFVDDELAYFPMALLRDCVHHCSKEACEYCKVLSGRGIEEYVKNSASSFFGGYDPGGREDPAACVVIEKTNDPNTPFRVLFAKTYQIQKKQMGEKAEANLYTRFTSEVADACKKFHARKVVVDSTGLGLPIVELCKSLQMPVQGLTLTSKSKEETLSGLRICLEQKKIILPYDLNFLANLNCVQAERTRTGGFSFSHDTGTHDDLAFATALALHAATRASSTVIMMKRD